MFYNLLCTETKSCSVHPFNHSSSSASEVGLGCLKPGSFKTRFFNLCTFSLCDSDLHLTDDIWPAWEHINHPGSLAPPTHEKFHVPVPQQHGCQ